MTAVLFFLIGVAMVIGGFYSMGRHDDIGKRFCAEITVTYSGLANIGIGFWVWLL